MVTAKLDPEHERYKKDLLKQGIRALSLKLDNPDITEENLGLFLYSKDPQVISRDGTYVWDEFFDELIDTREDMDALKHRKAKTSLWLGSKGYQVLNKEYPDLEICNYLWNWQEYWGTLVTDLENERDQDFYKPNLLQWALYLTIRGPVPQSFPSEGLFTYATKRWAEIRNNTVGYVDRSIPKGWKNPKAEEVATKYLLGQLRGLLRGAEDYLAKEEGTYQELVLKRLGPVYSLDL